MRVSDGFVMVGFLVSLSACDGARSRRAVAGDAARAEDPALDQGLAMMAPSGTTPVDKVVLQMQGRVTRDPKKLDSWVRLAQAWVRKARESSDPGYYANADAAAAMALRLAPDARMALDVRAMVQLNQHAFAEARATAQQILAHDPDDVTALGSLSDALLELGRYDEAMAAAQRMISLKPNLPSYSRASYLRWLQGDVAGARELMRNAIDAAGDGESRAWAIVQAANYFWHDGDHEGALAGYDTALRSQPDYPPALVGKAKVLLRRGQPADAAALLDRAYQHSPLVETAWLLGDAREAAGDAGGARVAYALVEKTGGTDPRTLSLFYATKGENTARAVALAKEELARRGDVYSEDAYAWALFKSGRIDEARQRIARAKRLGTKDLRILEHAQKIEG